MQHEKRSLIVLAVGGSGGHLFPARHLRSDLTNRGFKVAFMGHGLSKSSFFQNHQDIFYDIASAPIISKNPVKVLKGIFIMMKGIYQSVRVLKKLRPQLIVGFGSFHSFPIIFAAYLLKIPYVLFEANATMGRVTRLMGRKALVTCQTLLRSEMSNLSIPSIRVRHPACLVRVDRIEALQYYNLDPHKITLLVFGGSQGAKAVNQLVTEAIALSKVNLNTLQVLHLIGNHESKSRIEGAYDRLNIQCCVRTFESHMTYAWSLADLVIARSGASTVLEQLFYHVPAIYIPYPYAADNHQYHNALFAQRHLEAAVCFKEEEITIEKLALAIDHYLTYPYATQRMRERLKTFHVQEMLPSLSDILIQKLNQMEPI